jgi:drug/metabolite transporter (DMT)-like permease
MLVDEVTKRGAAAISAQQGVREPPGVGLWVWTVIVTLLGFAGFAMTIYEAISSPSARVAGEICSGVLWGAVVLRATKRQGLTPTWIWVTSGVTSGLLAVVPIWHHGREWKSTWRKMAGWTWFILFAIWLSYMFLRDFFAGVL